MVLIRHYNASISVFDPPVACYIFTFVLLTDEVSCENALQTLNHGCQQYFQRSYT
jgi:hypothetical protein